MAGGEGWRGASAGPAVHPCGSLYTLCSAPCSLLQLLCCPQPGRMHKQQTLTVSFSPFPRWRQPPWITHTHSLKHSELSLSFYHSIYFTVWGPTSRVTISAQNQCLEPCIWKNNKENRGLKQTNKQTKPLSSTYYIIATGKMSASERTNQNQFSHSI